MNCGVGMDAGGEQDVAAVTDFESNTTSLSAG